VFERDSKGKVTGSKTFQVTGLGPIAEKIRANASTISTLAQFEHVEAVTLRDYARTVFTNVLLFKQDASDAQLIEAYSTIPELMAGLNAEISRIDLGMRKMEVNTENPRGRYLQFQHDGLEAPVPWHFESHGTQSFIRSFPLLFRAMEDGGLAVIDELDASIHPLVLLEVTRWFQSSTRNKKNAQLWMTAQNVSLLEELAKEEIFLCEKDELGRTHVYGLQDIKAVRRADNFYRKYMSGAYGAIPNIG
jgi:predicted ATPase